MIFWADDFLGVGFFLAYDFVLMISYTLHGMSRMTLWAMVL